MAKEKVIEINDTSLWAAINLKSWNKTPAINGRLATEEDVKKGLAVYYINNCVNHTSYKFELPKLAYLTDEETKKEELVIVIQVEATSKDTVAGYRNLDGGNGACLLYELRFLDSEGIKALLGQ